MNYNLHCEYHYPSFDDDRTDWFLKRWIDAGVRVSYKINKIVISMESWFGLQNIADGPISGAEIYENHYRILFGYKF